MASTKMKEKGDDVTTSAGSALNTNKANIQPALTVDAGALKKAANAKANTYYGTWAGFDFNPANIELQVLVGVQSGGDGLHTCNIAQQ
jgi:hypothetical protein